MDRVDSVGQTFLSVRFADVAHPLLSSIRGRFVKLYDPPPILRAKGRL